MAINKEVLAALIATQTGNTEITADMFTDDMLVDLYIEDEVEEVEETDETEETEEEDVEDGEEKEEEEEENLLEGIDPNQLSPTERMFYDYVVKQEQRAKQREISLVIQGAQVSMQHKMVLDRMAKDGMSIKSIEKTIADFKQIEASSARIGGTTRIISKGKTKTTATQTKNQVPKLGTKEYGIYLANLKKGKK